MRTFFNLKLAVLLSVFIFATAYAIETTCTASSDPTQNRNGCVPCGTGDCCRSTFSMVACQYTAEVNPQK
jgi:hypothetical protein